MRISDMMLKNGFHYLLDENETQFKKSLIDVLSFKLNESVEYLNFQFKKSLLKDLKFKETANTPEMNTFINFLESYDSKNCSKIKLKNESLINITENEVKAIKSLFDTLNVKNRQKMAEDIFKDQKTFQEHLEFYNQTKVLSK